MLRKLFIVVAVLMFIGGIAFSSYPFIQNWVGEYHQQSQINDFNDYQNHLSKQSLNQLKKDMQQYNQEIFQNHQQNLRDAWDYEDDVFSLEEYGIDADVIGTLQIDAMDITLPLYLGASRDHLSQGASVLGQTSMPIGGNNVNTVIAGHRGYRGESMFRDIEKLHKGDTITLTNLWGEMSYKVYATTVITPNDIETVKIVEGYDMLTLVTCHPYTKNYQRYVVYCIRDDINVNIEKLNSLQIEDFNSSVNDIEREKYFSIFGICMSFLFIIVMVVLYKCKKSN